MARIGTRLMKVEIDGTEHTAELSRGFFTSAEGDTDFVTFADAAAGGSREYRFEFTAAQDAATGSLWREIWDSAGDTVVVTLIPYGNATPSATEPHFEASCVISEPDGELIGAEANQSPTAVATVEGSWVCTAKPTMVVA